MRKPSLATFRPEARPAAMTGMQARGAAAVGALAVGVAAVGGFAIGRLSIGRLAIGKLNVGAGDRQPARPRTHRARRRGRDVADFDHT